MKIKYRGNVKRIFRDPETGREFSWEEEGDVETMPKEIGEKILNSQPDLFKENGGEE